MVMLEQGGACGNIVGGLASAVDSANSRRQFSLENTASGAHGGLEIVT
jgi:hypothetical protein